MPLIDDGDEFSTRYPDKQRKGKLRESMETSPLLDGFNCYPTVYHTDFSRVNLGLTLMCGLNNDPFSSEARTLWLDVYFAGYCLNTTHVWTVARDWNYTNCAEDVFAGYFVGEYGQQEFGKWIPLSLDLGHFITRTLSQISCVNVNSIRVYGFILFVECLGAYAEVEYDYVSACV